MFAENDSYEALRDALNIVVAWTAEQREKHGEMGRKFVLEKKTPVFQAGKLLELRAGKWGNAGSQDKYTNSVRMIIFSVALGSFTHYILNFIKNRNSNIGRNTIDIWSGEVMAAIGQAALACIMAGYFKERSPSMETKELILGLLRWALFFCIF